MITTVAPAKINWTLEVLGRREDGYHEVRTVLQAIDLHDELSFETSDGQGISIGGSGIPDDEDLIAMAARRFCEAYETGGTIHVKKSVPISAGLGGGSSDAAATLRLLNAANGSPWDDEELSAMAAELGSDVPFFLHGGTALAEGRGERVTPLPLPDVAPTWLVVVVPPIAVPNKSALMYSLLEAADLSDGSTTGAFRHYVVNGGAPDPAMLINAFERAAEKMFPDLVKYRQWMIEAGTSSVHLSGAGPALFALTSGEAEARAIRARMNRPKMGERVYVVRTLTAAASTLTWDS